MQRRHIIPASLLTALTGFFICGFGLWMSHWEPRQGLRDKLEVRYSTILPSDSIEHLLQKIYQEREELDYYLSVHGVQDEGFGLVADRATRLDETARRLQQMKHAKQRTWRVLIKSYQRPMIAVKALGGQWKWGHWQRTPLQGKVILTDEQGRILNALYDADTIVIARRTDRLGVYNGQINNELQATGQGFYDAKDDSHFEGHWEQDKQHGWGFLSSPRHHVKAGEWKDGKYMGERLEYTSERIYGIDISRHQHEKGRRRYAIRWNQLRITHLGSLSRKRVNGQVDYPVSFVYIKATEGTTIKNRYYATDYLAAHRQGIKVGAYHFMSIRSSATAQANHFLRHAIIRSGDFPPVLDVEPSEGQIRQMGGEQALFNFIRTWMELVEKSIGTKPILYVNQMFVNRHLVNAPDIKQRYQIWIARYGEYKPDVKLVWWQLCPDGRVNGIEGPVDINVFNGYEGQYDRFLRERRVP